MSKKPKRSAKSDNTNKEKTQPEGIVVEQSKSGQPVIKEEGTAGRHTDLGDSAGTNDDQLLQTRLALLEEQQREKSSLFKRVRRQLNKSWLFQRVKRRLKKSLLFERVKERLKKLSESRASEEAVKSAEKLPPQPFPPDQEREHLQAEHERVSRASEAASDESSEESIFEILDRVQAEFKAESGNERLTQAQEPEVEARTSETEVVRVESAESTSPHPKLTLRSISRDKEMNALDDSDLRNVALEGYVEPPKQKVVVERERFDESFEKFTGGLKLRTLLRFASIFVLLAVMIFAAFSIISLLPEPAPKEVLPSATVIPTARPPYPIQVRLPGGWAFALSIGTVENSKWNPKQAEWLEGTEIGKWVALPWSAKLEAVFESMKPGDKIELVMSNYDHWLYRVESYKTVDTIQLSRLDRNTTSLFLVLAKEGATTWQVIIAVP